MTVHVSKVQFPSRLRPKGTKTLTLAGRLYLPPLAGLQVPGLVVGHGAGSKALRHDDFCQTACRAGFAVLALDFRGHGQSEGSADGPLELDVLAAAQYLRAHPAVDPDLICYRGSSMGGFYGLRAAAQAGFAALALVCPASPSVMLKGLAESWEDGGRRRQRASENQNDSEDKLEARWRRHLMRQYFQRELLRIPGEGVTCPVLVLHARGDDVVPLQDSLRLAASLTVETTLCLFPGGSHTSLQHDSAVHRLTVEWLQRYVQRARKL